jgi:hypothetical protein
VSDLAKDRVEFLFARIRAYFQLFEREKELDGLLATIGRA